MRHDVARLRLRRRHHHVALLVFQEIAIPIWSKLLAMKNLTILAVALVAVVGCGPQVAPPGPPPSINLSVGEPLADVVKQMGGRTCIIEPDGNTFSLYMLDPGHKLEGCTGDNSTATAINPDNRLVFVDGKLAGYSSQWGNITVQADQQQQPATPQNAGQNTGPNQQTTVQQGPASSVPGGN